MNRYAAMFERLKKNHQGAFIPFVMLYDPNRETCKKIIETLINSGADALELGIAFSDPLADGPTIQKAGLRALGNHATVQDSFTLIEEIRGSYPDIPIGILTYANLVYRNSLAWFYGRAHEVGVDSVLVADVPLLEIKPYFEAAIAHNIDPVLIAPHNLPSARLAEIAHYGRGYTYVVTRSGVTGADTKINFHHREFLQTLKEVKAPPAVFGFGIATPEHVRQALEEGAQGVISGSKVVSIIEDNLNNTKDMLEKLDSFVRTMKAATKFT